MTKRVILGAFLLAAVTSPGNAADATRYVTTSAKTHGVPVSFALKMARIESGVRCGQRNP